MPKSHLDWLGVVTLWLGALIMAIKAGGISAPVGAPAILTSGIWNYVPVILITVAGVIFIYRASQPPPVVVPAAPSKPAPTEVPMAAPQGVEPAPTPPPSSDKRDYLPASVVTQFIMMKLKDHTDGQVVGILGPHVGKWVRITGYIADVIINPTYLHVMIYPRQKTTEGRFSVFFASKDEAILASLAPRTKITFDAKITKSHGIRFEDAELL